MNLSREQLLRLMSCVMRDSQIRNEYPLAIRSQMERELRINDELIQAINKALGE